MPDIVIAGATFRGVPQIDIPKEGSGTASFVYEDGTKQITENGTGIDVSGYAAVDVAVPSSSPVIQSLSVTQNGEYTAPSGVDGYSPVTVDVSGGGGSSYELLTTAHYTVESATTTAVLLGTISGGSDFYRSDKIIYVKIRADAGKRAGYYFGSDFYFLNGYPASNISSDTISSQKIGNHYGRNSANTMWSNSNSGTSAVYPQKITSGGDMPIYVKKETNVGTISGNITVEVYALAWPNSVSPFDA